MQEDFGRLRGSGVTRPRRARYRLIVAGETRTWWWCSRCQAMVYGACVQALIGELLAEPDDQVGRVCADGPR